MSEPKNGKMKNREKEGAIEILLKQKKMSTDEPNKKETERRKLQWRQTDASIGNGEVQH